MILDPHCRANQPHRLLCLGMLHMILGRPLANILHDGIAYIHETLVVILIKLGTGNAKIDNCSNNPDMYMALSA